MIEELTQKQLDRQDFVDNAIYNLLKELLPPKYEGKEVYWDIDAISEIRELACERLYRIINVSTNEDEFEMEFYPWMTQEL